MELVDILANVTSVCMILMMLSGVPTCLDIRKKGSTENVSPICFIAGYFNSGLWLNYGYFVPIPAMLFVCIMGTVLNILYVGVYYVYSSTKRSLVNKLLAVNCFLLLVSYYTIYVAVPEQGEWLAGAIACGATILFIAAPLAELGTVIRTKSTESLPKTMVFGNLLLSVLNLWYGILLGDMFFQIPNYIGTIISLITSSLFIIYPSKTKLKHS